MCKCTGNVIYGKGSTWTEAMEADNEIACTNGLFGDPVHGTLKECLCFPSFKCADENEVCQCNGTVIYGKGSTWTVPSEADNEIACTNGVFGDPIHGTVKECICLPSGNVLTLISYILALLLDVIRYRDPNVTSKVFSSILSFSAEFDGQPIA